MTTEERYACKGSIRRQFIIETMTEIGMRHNKNNVFSDFVEMAAIALNKLDFIHRDDQEIRYLEIIKKYGKKDQMLFPEMMANLIMEITELLNEGVFENVLGDIYMGLGVNSMHSAQIFTPENINEMMASILDNGNEANINEKGYEVCLDPTCGSGGQIIKMAQNIGGNSYDYQEKMVAMAVDIDALCVHMSFAQLTLYCIPAVIIHGNSLKLETYARWYTPVYLLDNWIWRENLTLDGKRCIEDLRIKCALEPTYALMLQLNSVFRSNKKEIDTSEVAEKVIPMHEQESTTANLLEQLSFGIDSGAELREKAEKRNATKKRFNEKASASTSDLLSQISLFDAM